MSTTDGPVTAADSVVARRRPVAGRAAALTGGRLFDYTLSRGWPTYVGGVLVLSLLKYGVGLLPSWNYMQALAANWRHPLVAPLLQPPADFRLRTPTSAVAAGWLHLTAGPQFLGLHFLLACVAIAVPLTMPVVRRSAELRLTVALLLIGGAIPAILLDWVGSYDPVSVGAAAVAALALRREVAFLAWLVFAFNNAPEAALALVFIAIILLVDQRRAAVPRIAVCAAGAVIGYVGIRVVDNAWGGGSSEFNLLKYYGYSRYVSGAVHFWPLIVGSALGVGWLLFLSRETRAVPAVRTFVGLAALASVGVPLIALDETRVTATVLWAPALVTATILVRRLPAADVHRLLRRAAPAALLIVIVMVWDGSLVYAGWNSMWSFIGYVFNHHPIPVSA